MSVLFPILSDILLSKKQGRMITMYQIRNVNGHVQVYDRKGAFLFSADSEREAREELESYAELAA